jgi:glutaredoxin 3
MIKNIKIYTTATCVYCKAEKEFLDQHQVKYETVPVDVDADAAEEMIQKSGQMGVPVTLITKDDNSEEVIVGFNQPRLAHTLGL